MRYIISALICLMSIAVAAQEEVTLWDYDFNGFMPQDIAVTFEAGDDFFEQDIYDSTLYVWRSQLNLDGIGQSGQIYPPCSPNSNNILVAGVGPLETLGGIAYNNLFTYAEIPMFNSMGYDSLIVSFEAITLNAGGSDGLTFEVSNDGVNWATFWDPLSGQLGQFTNPCSPVSISLNISDYQADNLRIRMVHQGYYFTIIDNLKLVGYTSQNLLVGCTYPNACNYSSLAEIEDQSCYFIGDSCDDDNGNTANDMYSENCDCVGEAFVFGCTDQTACNYDESANNDNGSCFYANPGYDCEGECLEDLDEDGICDNCDELLYVVVDCDCEFFDPATYTVFFTDVDEENCIVTEDCSCECYNDFDGDGICDENEVSGCTYEAACNYNPSVEFDDNTCVFIGDSCDDDNPNTIDDVIQEDCECRGTSAMMVDELEGLSVKIYPNPASNSLNVDLGDLNGVETTVKIHSFSGQVVFEEVSSSNLLIDISKYAKGAYTLELTTSDSVLRSHVVVE